MDFQKDLREIAENMLDYYGLKHTPPETTEDKLHRWLNTQFKLIEPLPRKLFFSKKIQNHSLPADLIDGYDLVKAKLTNGVDVNGHLSKSIFYNDKPDYLFYDWGIYHLHLSKEQDSKNRFFLKRTDELLFLYLNKANAYLIDIRPHNEDYVFAQKELLQIIHEEWIEVLEPFKLKGMMVAQEINNAEDIHKLRDAGVLVVHKVGNDSYMPMGGGLSTAATSINVTTESDRLTIMARNAEKWINENIIDVKRQINLVKPEIVDFDFKLLMNDKGFFIYEINSKIAKIN